ncbi:MAG: hypothetical protein ACOC5T_08325 [Elusimicrobiota bacterium]
MASVGGVDLGNVTTERSSKESNLFTQPIPYSDSTDTLMMDIFGTTRTITVEGSKTGTLSELRTFVENIEDLQNGQQSGMTFESSWTNDDKTVLIQNFEHSKAEGDVSRVTYSITLVEGTAL